MYLHREADGFTRKEEREFLVKSRNLKLQLHLHLTYLVLCVCVY